MNYSDVERLPGVIIDANDPLKLGRVKATAPCLFNENEQDKELLPWIYPENMRNYQSFSMPVEGAKIWILHNTSNYLELWWRPMFELNKPTEQLLNSTYGHDNEILISRPTESGSAQFYYDSLSGFNMKLDNCTWNLSKTSVSINTEGAGVTVRDGHVYMGNLGGESFHTVKGEKISELLNKLSEQFKQLATVANNGDNTGFINMFTELSSLTRSAATRDIWSENTFIN